MAMDGKVDQMLGLNEVAKFLDVSKRTVYRLIAQQALPRPVKVRRGSKIPEADLIAYQERIKRERNR